MQVCIYSKFFLLSIVFHNPVTKLCQHPLHHKYFPSNFELQLRNALKYQINSSVIDFNYVTFSTLASSSVIIYLLFFAGRSEENGRNCQRDGEELQRLRWRRNLNPGLFPDGGYGYRQRYTSACVQRHRKFHSQLDCYGRRRMAGPSSKDRACNDHGNYHNSIDFRESAGHSVGYAPPETACNNELLCHITGLGGHVSGDVRDDLQRQRADLRVLALRTVYV